MATLNQANKMAWELIEAGDLISKGDDYFEDMGGHLISIRAIPDYFENYLKRLSDTERKEVLKRLAEDG